MLTLLEVITTKSTDGHKLGKFICSCGEIVINQLSRVKRGLASNCKKCARRIVSNCVKTHGMKKTPEYRTWTGIKNRCLNKNSRDYKRYGGSGITICELWRNSFEEFYKYMGPKPSARHSVDRIDNLKGYEPGNVRWASTFEQQRNKKTSVYVTNGTSIFHINDVALLLGISRGAAAMRLKRGKLNGFTKNT